jgi:hypothetical protein
MDGWSTTVYAPPPFLALVFDRSRAWSEEPVRIGSYYHAIPCRFIRSFNLFPRRDDHRCRVRVRVDAGIYERHNNVWRHFDNSWCSDLLVCFDNGLPALLRASQIQFV